MSRNTVFIAKAKSSAVLENQFHWKFGSNPEVQAEQAMFYLSEFPPTGELSWAISGSTGSFSDENYFGYIMSFPYSNDAPFKATYTLKNKLSFQHIHSIPAPEGFTGWTVVDADEGTLSVDLDPSKGIVVGHFEARFKSHGYRTQPVGSFNLLISQ